MATAVIGINGSAGSGKSVAAETFEKQGFTRVKMASPLKAMVRGFYKELGVDEETIERKIEGDLKEIPCSYFGGRTPRYVMQTLGTEWGRKTVHPDLWVRAWSTAVDQVDGPVVCDDVRFENEVKAIRSKDGVVMKVHRETTDRNPGQHSSEQGLPPHLIDGVLFNVGSKEEFVEAVKSMAILAYKEFVRE